MVQRAPCALQPCTELASAARWTQSLRAWSALSCQGSVEVAEGRLSWKRALHRVVLGTRSRWEGLSTPLRGVTADRAQPHADQALQAKVGGARTVRFRAILAKGSA